MSLDDKEFQNRILLVNLPFWTPLIPAQGIASLKAFLQEYDYIVKIVDAAADNRFLEFYRDYFSLLKRLIPAKNWGNFYNIGHDVLRNHLEAHTLYENRERYLELLKLLVYNTYHIFLEETQIESLDKIIERFFQLLKEYFLDLLREENPAVLGLSVNSGNLGPSTYIFKLTREHFPLVKTVMGGSIFFNHFALGTPDLERFLKRTESYIDKLFIGKGEILLLKYLQGELPPGQRVYTLNDIGDIGGTGEKVNRTSLNGGNEMKQKFFGGAGGAILQKAGGARSRPKVAIPDMSDFNLDRYFYLSASASSSCPNKCSFCNVRFFFGDHKVKDPQQVVREMALLHEKYGHHLFFMEDSLMNTVIDDLSLGLKKENLPVYLDGYFRVDEPSCDIRKTMSWREAGFYRVRIGAESGAQHVLDMMGKKISPGLIKRSISSFANAGIKTTAYWVIGHPGETEEDFQKTLDLVEELKDDIWECECNPFTYYYRGQAAADEWADKRLLIYPEYLEDMLLTRTWGLDCAPARDEIYERVFRFVERCDKLGIPNTYTIGDIVKADERWKKLHENAVPSVLELSPKAKNIEDRVRRRNVEPHTGLILDNNRKLLRVQYKNDSEGGFDFELNK